jgi:hypothetical protein
LNIGLTFSAAQDQKKIVRGLFPMSGDLYRFKLFELTSIKKGIRTVTWFRTVLFHILREISRDCFEKKSRDIFCANYVGSSAQRHGHVVAIEAGVAVADYS